MKYQWRKAAILTLAVAATLVLGACQNKTAVITPQSEAEAQSGGEVSKESGFTMYYPEYMAEQEGDTLSLDQKPEKIIVLSDSALQIMVRCHVKPIAAASPSSFVDYPEWVNELPVIKSARDTLDTESIISMEPDLVIMGSHLKKAFEGVLNKAGIPVYYTSEGPSVTYKEVREEAQALTKSFGTPEDLKEIEQEFDAVEERAERFKNALEEKKAMILFSFPPSYQQTSKGYLGSILSMLPFQNLSDTLIDPEERTAPLDLEKMVELNPEVIFAISPTVMKEEDLKNSYAKEIKDNPGIWGKLQAAENDAIICLPSEYVTSQGIHIIDSINTLIDRLAEKFSVEVPASDPAGSDKTAQIVIEYPKNMQEKGYTEPVVLNHMPQKTVAMSITPVLTLYRLGVPMVAIPESSVVTWPENLAEKAVKLNVTMNKNFDIETVVAMEPDLVILGYTNRDTYGRILADAGIPTYYVDEGHTVSYDSIKQQTEALSKAFGSDSKEGKAILKSFTELEERLSAARKKYKDKTVMVLQSAPPAHYIQTKDGTLGSMMDMLGFTNVYENSASSMAELDMESALSYNPDLIVAVGSSKTATEHQKLMEEDFAKNNNFWNSIPAISEGNIIYLPVNYISSAGVAIIDHINQLLGMIDRHYEAEEK